MLGRSKSGELAKVSEELEETEVETLRAKRKAALSLAKEKTLVERIYVAIRNDLSKLIVRLEAASAFNYDATFRDEIQALLRYFQVEVKDTSQHHRLSPVLCGALFGLAYQGAELMTRYIETRLANWRGETPESRKNLLRLELEQLLQATLSKPLHIATDRLETERRREESYIVPNK